MKFSSSHLGEKSHHNRHSQREKWGWFSPLLWSFLGMTAIVSFFFFFFFSSLSPPNPFLVLRPKLLGLQSVHDHDPIASPPKEKQRCNLFKGNWVKDVKGAATYTNWSCPTIPESKNCFKQGRKDSDFVNWRWKPDECELPRFDPMAFLHLLRGKKLAFIGDSVARNHMESLLCILSQVETPEDVYKDSEDRFRRWYFPKSEVTLMMLWTKFLVAGEERVLNGTGTGVFDLQFDKLDDGWTRHLPDIDYAIISNGHWFFRVLYLHEEDTKIGKCIYCSDPNITNYDPDFALKMAFRAALKYINNCKSCGKLVTFVRTFSPAHFENGVWNTGGYCNRTRPSSAKDINLESFDWKMREVQIEEIEKAKQEAEARRRFEVIDVTMAMMMRADGHPGEFWGNKWMKGYNDCVHWCLPGPIDAWNDLLMALITKEAAMDS
ncbi:protein ALTERED XYLOGLUCAN 4-like [Cucumis melo var. makuwa]|uniref:Protein ALTERED XYLOGLUCAN 4-like n=1 Tax=Cucumis melo var. makuwa TaxID=1194695 RepID=A0A5A7UF32_CUCMM|nr:protein ALTERED XYLOGLUCAN 4-like [Cucumis melo var. makuwa]